MDDLVKRLQTRSLAFADDLDADAADRIEALDKRNKELSEALRWTLGSIDKDHPAKKVLRVALLGEKKDG